MTSTLTETKPTPKTQSRWFHNPQLRVYAAFVLGVICIGFSAIFTKWANVDGPVSGFYRVAIATVVLALPYALRSVHANQSSVVSRQSSVKTQNSKLKTPHNSLTLFPHPIPYSGAQPSLASSSRATSACGTRRFCSLRLLTLPCWATCPPSG